MRIAVVDVGTNTTRLYIAEVLDGQVTAELTRLSRVTRLGAGVDASGRLAADALAREYAVLDEYQRLIAAAGAERAVAVMTSAVRDAANGSEFADDVADRFGLDVQVLSGEAEAQLTYLGATDQLDGDADDAATLVFDIGGGSTELVTGHGKRLDFHVSTQAGVVRHADRHIHSDPPTAAELEAVAADVRAVFEAAVPAERRATPGRAFGVAGTPTSLAAIAQELEPYDSARVHGYRLSAAQRDRIFARLAAMPLAQRKRVRGLHPDRAIAILPGIVILAEIMALFGLEQFTVSEHDILRGAALHHAER
ncbi:MAG TPA: Ppx/GppA phosphatase family protein [Solirubrobacteraceae bacterium]|nr:Ppx/GppA phosphatase family protein [Solirubrobacteraceae bacterium]